MVSLICIEPDLGFLRCPVSEFGADVALQADDVSRYCLRLVVFDMVRRELSVPLGVDGSCFLGEDRNLGEIFILSTSTGSEQIRQKCHCDILVVL